MPITLEVPAATNHYGYQEFVIPMFFNITDDDINENEQIFVIVAELGPDVTDTPFDFSCFRVGEYGCYRSGVTEIRITDNDRKYIL